MRSTYSPAFGGSFRQRSFNSGRSDTLSQRQFTPRTYSGSSGLARSENSRHFRTTQSERFTQLQSDRVNRLEDVRTRRSDRLGQFENRRTRDFGTIRNTREDRAGAITTNTRSLTSGTVTDTHVYARRSADWQPNWDRSCDHWWRGHRCRFVNGYWFIFNLGFTPWYGYPYDYYASDYYYPYGYDAGYYGGGYYDSGYYGDAGYYSSDQYDADTVAAAQEELARQGYYRGRIDGIFGPATRRAVWRYQSDHGLAATGSLNSDTLQSLNLRIASY